MFGSCMQTQRLAPGERTLSPTSHLTSSRSDQRLLKPGGRGPGPRYSFSHFSLCSSSSCLGLSPPSSSASQQDDHLQQRSLVVASLKPPNGKGYGTKNLVEKKTKPTPFESSEATSSSSSSLPAVEQFPQYWREEVDDDNEVPEIVTNRMLKRIALTVGVPLAFGLLLFPLFYYLKIVSKVDVPEWLPLVVSMVTFGTAGFEITYGVVSASWDPERGGSLLGWKEAQVNWPLIWDKFQGSDTNK